MLGVRSVAVARCPQRLAAIPTVRSVVGPARTQRGALQVVAAEEKKGDKKKMYTSAEKRVLIAEQRRIANKSRRSACATRIKKVIKLAQNLLANPPKTEEEIAPLEQLIREAYKEIGKAEQKGVYHANTAARRKARCAAWKKRVLIQAGLYTPQPASQ